MITGKSVHRWKQNPLEEMFARVWDRQNQDGHTLEYLLSDDPNQRVFVDDETQEAAATIIQWLGSPVGQGFLEEVLGFNVRDQIPEHLRMK